MGKRLVKPIQLRKPIRGELKINLPTNSSNRKTFRAATKKRETRCEDGCILQQAFHNLLHSSLPPATKPKYHFSTR